MACVPLDVSGIPFSGIQLEDKLQCPATSLYLMTPRYSLHGHNRIDVSRHHPASCFFNVWKRWNTRVGIVPSLHQGSSCLQPTPRFTCWNYDSSNSVFYKPLLLPVFLFCNKYTIGGSLKVFCCCRPWVSCSKRGGGTRCCLKVLQERTFALLHVCISPCHQP